MRKEVKFENDSELKDFQEYDENKLAIAKICVLSTAPNSHQLNISEEVLRRDIGTIRGNFLVADMQFGDATTHTPNEVPVGYFLPNEPIEFEEVEKNGAKIVKAWAYAVLSKRYASAAYEMFVKDNHRATSIEMTVETPEDDEHEVLSFNAFGSTILGKTVAPSCKDAEMSLVRFAEEANTFFGKQKESIVILKQFVEERKKKMAESKSYKIDKNKDAMVTSPWSEVDKTDLRNKIIEASNAKTLVKSVYLKIDSDWEEAPSERLHYPVMQFKGDTLVYNRNALSNALARAVQNNEDAVIDKIKKIYKSLGLEQDGKEDDAKMAEIEFAAVDIGDMWGRLYEAINRRQGWEYSISGIYEQDNKKFAVLKDRGGESYRLDFSLTEEGLIIADEIVKVQTEFIETDDVKKFAEPDNAEKYKKFEDDDSDDEDDDNDDKSDDDKDDEDKEEKMSKEDMMAKISELQKSVEERDNIIMEKGKKMGEMEAELSELREYKAACEKKELATSVESIMAEVKDCMSEDKYKEFRDEGLTCKMSELDAWSNKVKAFCFENGKVNKSIKKNDIFSFAAPVENNQKPMNVWDRLKNL